MKKYTTEIRNLYRSQSAAYQHLIRVLTVLPLAGAVLFAAQNGLPAFLKLLGIIVAGCLILSTGIAIMASVAGRGDPTPRYSFIDNIVYAFCAIFLFGAYGFMVAFIASALR